ncbi:MAG TPA: hypothetical protein VF600_14875 [Abditibacteriaceae bacterium]
MDRTHFVLWYRLDNKDHYLIWYHEVEGDSCLDGVVLDSASKIPIFVAVDELQHYARSQEFEIDAEEPRLHNLDIVLKWLKTRRATQTLHCDACLTAWNLFADVSRSLSGSFDADQQRTHKIYQKLFFGSNLPALTPSGKHYIPLWSSQELKIIREVMNNGLALLRAHTRLQTVTRRRFP